MEVILFVGVVKGIRDREAVACYQDQREFFIIGRGRGIFSEEIKFLGEDKNHIQTALLLQFWLI